MNDLLPEENLQVKHLNDIRDQIRQNILEKGHSYIYGDDKQKSDHDRGVLNAIRLIEHCVHCICD